MNAEIIQAIKDEMGYSDGKDCCSACKHYVPTDCSGNHNAKSEHCKRNAFDVPVNTEGRCKHWESK